MPSIGLVGGGFVSESSFVDDQRTVNFFPEITPSGRGRVSAVLYRTPGTKSRLTGFNGAGRGCLALNDHVFAVMGTYLYDITNGWIINATYGPIATDGKPVHMAANPDQLFVVSAGLGYILEAGVLTQVVDPDFPVNAIAVGYVNGYFLALTTNLGAVGHSNALYYSAVGDGTSWDALDFIEVLASANSLVGLAVDNQQIFIFGTEITAPFQLVGGAIPFVPILGAATPVGLAATNGVVVTDNSPFIVGRNKDGNGIIYRVNGYDPQRVSNHDIEKAIQSYGDISDCVASSMQINGHTFIQFSFPSVVDPTGNVVGATWRMDAATPGIWHEALRWNSEIARYEEHTCRYTAFAFNKHVGLSRDASEILEISQNFLDDDGDSIHRLRRCPHLFDPISNSRMYYSDLELLLPPGLSANATLVPTVMMRFSNNWGKTWSNIMSRVVGVTGEFGAHVFFNRLGSARASRVFEFTVTDAYDWVFADALCNYHRGR